MGNNMKYKKHRTLTDDLRLFGNVCQELKCQILKHGLDIIKNIKNIYKK